MQISEQELADFLYDISMKTGKRTITRQDAMRLAMVMYAAGEAMVDVLAEDSSGW